MQEDPFPFYPPLYGSCEIRTIHKKSFLNLSPKEPSVVIILPEAYTGVIMNRLEWNNLGDNHASAHAILDNAFSQALSKTSSELNGSDLNTLKLKNMARSNFPESENFLMLLFGAAFPYALFVSSDISQALVVILMFNGIDIGTECQLPADGIGQKNTF